MTQPSDGGEHEGENLKEVFGEPFNFIKLNLNVNGNSIGGESRSLSSYRGLER